MPQASAGFSYDARNLLSNITRPNGVTSTLTYDAATRLQGISHHNGPNVLDAENYAYDAAGNRTSHTTLIGQSLTTTATSSAVYDGDNEQTQFGPTTNAFDANGNLISTAGSGGNTTFTWDSRNRLKTMVTSAGQTTNFTYDFAGNLILQTDMGSSLNLTKTFVLDDLTNVAYQAASDGTSYSVLSGQSIDSHLAIAQSNGQVLYGLADAINSTVASVDQTGTIRGQFLYEPFGQTTATGPYPFQFAGRTPVSSSLYYNRARFYNSQTGRFISEDPLGFDGGDVNFYRYVNNDPQNQTDPLGFWSVPGCILGICIIFPGPTPPINIPGSPVPVNGRPIPGKGGLGRPGQGKPKPGACPPGGEKPPPGPGGGQEPEPPEIPIPSPSFSPTPLGPSVLLLFPVSPFGTGFHP